MAETTSAFFSVQFQAAGKGCGRIKVSTDFEFRTKPFRTTILSAFIEQLLNQAAKNRPCLGKMTRFSDTVCLIQGHAG
jgi:hypothetical protein